MGTVRNVGDLCNKRTKNCLCHLPMDLLLCLLSHLSILDYKSVCGVCKCWRKAFSRCPISLIRQKQNDPWFVLLRAVNDSKQYSYFRRPSLYTTGKLGNLLSGGRIYTPYDMPELCGTQLLLSRHGWLLLFSDSRFSSSVGRSQSKNKTSPSSSQLFFFDPFSRARINLPFMDVSKLTGPVFEISATPTSSHCIVIVISRPPNIVGAKSFFEISTCRRGESAWTTKEYLNSSRTGVPELGVVTNAVFVNGVFCCLHHGGFFSVVDAGNNGWRYSGFVKRDMYYGDDFPLVSYTAKSEIDNEDVMFVHSVAGYAIVLEEPSNIDDLVSYFLDDSDVRDNEFMLRFSLNGEMILQLLDRLKLSSFNIHAWCGSFTATPTATQNKNNMALFHWHRFTSCLDLRMARGKSKTKICSFGREREPETNRCDTRVAWFEPTLVDSYNLDLDWSHR